MLIKTVNDSGLNKVNFYVDYDTASGSPTQFGAAAEGKVYEVFYSHMNLPGEMGELTQGFKAKFNKPMYATAVYIGLAGLSHGMAKAQCTNALAVTKALEGLEYLGAYGTVKMCKAEHQLQQDLVHVEVKPSQ